MDFVTTITTADVLTLASGAASMDDFTASLNALIERTANMPPAAAVVEETKPVKVNRYGGKCVDCGVWVEAEAGELVGRPGSWGSKHFPACPEPAPIPESSPEVAEIEPVTDGMYRTADGTIYKVQVAVHGSGNLYAKVLDVASASFIYQPGAIKKLTAADKMTLAEAQEFGHLYGFCCVCGKTLTDERSIAAGIGPVCSGKEGRFAA